MKASSIQIGKKYEITVGRGAAIVKVIDINRKTGAWICETQNGKDISVSDARRFLKAIDDGKRAKKGKPPKEAVPKSKSQKKTATSPVNEPEAKKTEIAVNQPVTATEFVAQLFQTFKEAETILKAAQNAFKHELIEQGKLDTVVAKYDAARATLRAAGGKLGSGGRCRGRMSGLEAAYRVLSETGIPMNARQICEMALEKGYWEPQGATPDATMSSAILTEMKKKGADARFERPGRGLFAAVK